MTNIFPQEVLFGYERCWLTLLTFVSLVLTIAHSGSILAPHKDLLPKLKIACTFLLIMNSVPTEVGGLSLYSLEIKSGVQVIQHLVSLLTSYAP